MDNVDEHIKELVKAKFLEDGYYYKPELDGSSDDISVLKTDMGWVCGCYSDWTRDDNFIVRAEMKTLTRTVEFAYNTWFGCGMRGSGTQIIMKMEGLTYRDAVVRAEEITGDRDTSVRSGSGRRNAVPGGSGNYRSYREIRDAGIREDSDPGA